MEGKESGISWCEYLFTVSSPRHAGSPVVAALQSYVIKDRVVYTAKQYKMVEAGMICEVTGLQSAKGKELNGLRCAVLSLVDEQEDRWQVSMEQQDPYQTKAIK